MNGELYNAVKTLKIENLTTVDKEELLRIFMVTKHHGIRNQISLIFSDLKYNEAVPYIIKKINDRTLSHNVGTLVYSLENLDSKKHFLEFINIICQQEYEPRLMAYSSIEKYAGAISKRTRKKALQILEDHRLKQQEIDDDKYENSTLHFIEATKNLLVI